MSKAKLKDQIKELEEKLAFTERVKNEMTKQTSLSNEYLNKEHYELRKQQVDLKADRIKLQREYEEKQRELDQEAAILKHKQLIVDNQKKEAEEDMRRQRKEVIDSRREVQRRLQLVRRRELESSMASGGGDRTTQGFESMSDFNLLQAFKDKLSDMKRISSSMSDDTKFLINVDDVMEVIDSIKQTQGIGHSIPGRNEAEEEAGVALGDGKERAMNLPAPAMTIGEYMSPDYGLVDLDNDPYGSTYTSPAAPTPMMASSKIGTTLKDETHSNYGALQQPNSTFPMLAPVGLDGLHAGIGTDGLGPVPLGGDSKGSTVEPSELDQILRSSDQITRKYESLLGPVEDLIGGEEKGKEDLHDDQMQQTDDIDELFDRIDRNKDGVISRAEFRRGVIEEPLTSPRKSMKAGQ
mmetsp:Transcript_21210/g.29715  ORF Transcript_21210/g.29715 Transcript_21210/m.29715 type:complete len:409 (-) Transcript_21210:223-1449(-)